MKQLILILLASALIACVAQAQTTTIILVRHAEQDKNPPNDPPLNAQGQARAELLAISLSKLPISAAYTTTLLRAKATAWPTTKANNVELTHYKLEDDEAQFIQSIVKKHNGKNVLLIGHSGNIAELLNGATQSKKYDDKAIDGFSDFYVLTFVGTAPAVVTRLKYGQ